MLQLHITNFDKVSETGEVDLNELEFINKSDSVETDKTLVKNYVSIVHLGDDMSSLNVAYFNVGDNLDLLQETSVEEPVYSSDKISVVDIFRHSVYQLTSMDEEYFVDIVSGVFQESEDVLASHTVAIIKNKEEYDNLLVDLSKTLEKTKVTTLEYNLGEIVMSFDIHAHILGINEQINSTHTQSEFSAAQLSYLLQVIISKCIGHVSYRDMVMVNHMKLEEIKEAKEEA